MRAFIEASLVLTLSLAITLLILGAIFARHPLGAKDFALDYPEISPAVFVEGSHVRPGSAADPMRPITTDDAQIGQCPYLASLAAATACPAMPEDRDASTCPYLREIYRQYVEAPAQPDPIFGQDT